MTMIYLRCASIVFCAWLTWAGAFQWKATTNDQQKEVATVMVTSDGLVQDGATVNLQQAADDGTGKEAMVIVPSGGLLQEGATITTHGDSYVQHVDVPPAVRNGAHQMVEAINHMSTAQVQAVERMMHPAPDATFPSDETEHEITQMDASARKMLDQILQGQLGAAEETAIKLDGETKTLKAHDPNFDPDTDSTKLAELARGNADAATKSIAAAQSLTNLSCSLWNAPYNQWTNGPCYPCDCWDRYIWCHHRCGASNCLPVDHWCSQVAEAYEFQGQGQGALLEKHVTLGVVDKQGDDLGNMRNDDLMMRPGQKGQPGQPLKLLNDPLVTRSGARKGFQGKPMSRAGFAALIQRASQFEKANASIDRAVDLTTEMKACS